MRRTIHLHPTADLAERVLLPGDPGRALRLAQALLESPKMFNHHRGLWGYTGQAGDGESLTIQSTGMGGPSAAIVVAELADLGARRFVRVGTCGAIDRSLSLGDLLIVRGALSADGTSRALGADGRVAPSAALLSALLAAAPPGARSGAVVSTDLFYDGPSGQEQAWQDGGALALGREGGISEREHQRQDQGQEHAQRRARGVFRQIGRIERHRRHLQFGQRLEKMAAGLGEKHHQAERQQHRQHIPARADAPGFLDGDWNGAAHAPRSSG